MGGLEAVLTGVRDEFSYIINRYKYGREVITVLVCGSAFIFAVQNITNVSTVAGLIMELRLIILCGRFIVQLLSIYELPNFAVLVISGGYVPFYNVGLIRCWHCHSLRSFLSGRGNWLVLR